MILINTLYRLIIYHQVYSSKTTHVSWYIFYDDYKNTIFLMVFTYLHISIFIDPKFHIGILNCLLKIDY